jgi:hypothetical protein
VRRTLARSCRAVRACCLRLPWDSDRLRTRARVGRRPGVRQGAIALAQGDDVGDDGRGCQGADERRCPRTSAAARLGRARPRGAARRAVRVGRRRSCGRVTGGHIACGRSFRSDTEGLFADAHGSVASRSRSTASRSRRAEGLRGDRDFAKPDESVLFASGPRQESLTRDLEPQYVQSSCFRGALLSSSR